jgi:hypothetical protein
MNIPQDLPPNLSDTEYKLEEAKFFLNLMTKHRGRFHQFNFYFSAFISAANSVYFVMKKEFVRTPGWAAWQRQKAQELSEEANDLLRRTRDMRNHSLKRGTLRAGALTKLKVPKPHIERLRNVGPGDFMLQGTLQNLKVVHRHSVTGELTFFPFTTAKTFARVEPQYMNYRNLLLECHKYYDLLAPFVGECVEKFGDQSR